MILTQCAVCATDLGLSLGKKCGRCSTRYCGAECQKQHWEQGGHDKLCKPIKRQAAQSSTTQMRSTQKLSRRGGGVRRGHEGPDVHICTQALHWKRRRASCACVRAAGRRDLRTYVSGGAGKDFVRGSRGEQFGGKVLAERWQRWHECSLCEQGHHGVVSCALGWAKRTYLGRQKRTCSAQRDENAWERFIHCKSPRGRVVCERD